MNQRGGKHESKHLKEWRPGLLYDKPAGSVRRLFAESTVWQKAGFATGNKSRNRKGLRRWWKWPKSWSWETADPLSE